jgi:catechol 2,3-dioxygenase-like lactoylglutathione lyase family enzyme
MPAIIVIRDPRKRAAVAPEGIMMKFMPLLALCLVLVGAVAASAADSAVSTIAFDDLHIRVSDPAKAGDWYVKYLGATPTQSPHRVSFGRTLIIFSQGDNPGPSTVIDHFGLSFRNVDAKIRELTAAGAKVLTPAADRPGLFRLGFIEDPFRIKIEVVEDSELLGFHHVHLNVPDPDATLKWYEAIFGGKRAKLKGRIDGLRYATIPNNILGLGTTAKSAGDVWLLAAKSDKLNPTADRVIYNLAFLVEDINQTAAGLKSKGAKITREARTTKVEGLDTGVMFAEDANGVQIELLQRQKQ